MLQGRNLSGCQPLEIEQSTCKIRRWRLRSSETDPATPRR